MRGPLVCVAFSGVFVATPAPTAAQDLSMPVPCTAYGSESDSEAQARCNRERESNYNNAAIAEAQQENIRIGKELLAAVRSKPNLPAAKNRLIGRWQAPRRPKVDGNADFVTGLMDGLKMLEGGLCTIMFGDGGEIEFYATGWASTDSLGRDDLGPVTYKDVGPDMVGVLPAQGIQNMVFQFDGPNTIRLITDTESCNLTRIGGFIRENVDALVERWELCTFNNLCVDKYEALGLDWAFCDCPPLNAADARRLAETAGATGAAPDIVHLSGPMNEQAVRNR